MNQAHDWSLYIDTLLPFFPSLVFIYFHSLLPLSSFFPVLLPYNHTAIFHRNTKPLSMLLTLANPNPFSKCSQLEMWKSFASVVLFFNWLEQFGHLGLVSNFHSEPPEAFPTPIFQISFIFAFHSIPVHSILGWRCGIVCQNMPPSRPLPEPGDNLCDHHTLAGAAEYVDAELVRSSGEAREEAGTRLVVSLFC